MKTLLLILLFVSSVYADIYTTVTGKITDSITGAGVPLVTVTAYHNNAFCSWINDVTLTNPFGFYLVTVDTNCEIITIEPYKKNYIFEPTTHIIIFLTPSDFPITNKNFTGIKE